MARAPLAGGYLSMPGHERRLRRKEGQESLGALRTDFTFFRLPALLSVTHFGGHDKAQPHDRRQAARKTRPPSYLVALEIHPGLILPDGFRETGHPPESYPIGHYWLVTRNPPSDSTDRVNN